MSAITISRSIAALHAAARSSAHLDHISDGIAVADGHFYPTEGFAHLDAALVEVTAYRYAACRDGEDGCNLDDGLHEYYDDNALDDDGDPGAWCDHPTGGDAEVIEWRVKGIAGNGGASDLYDSLADALADAARHADFFADCIADAVSDALPNAPKNGGEIVRFWREVARDFSALADAVNDA